MTCDEMQRRNPMPGGSADWMIGQIVSAKVDRQGIGVIYLDEIINEREDAVGKPFVDRQRGGVPSPGRDICGPERRCAKSPSAVGQTANGEICKLSSKCNRVNQPAAI